eukprot:gene8046-10901_t
MKRSSEYRILSSKHLSFISLNDLVESAGIDELRHQNINYDNPITNIIIQNFPISNNQFGDINCNESHTIYLSKLTLNNLKEYGNELFKINNFVKAELVYTFAINKLYNNNNDNNNNDNNNNELKISLLLNRSLVRIKQLSYNNALSDCEMVLELDPINLKGFYRKGLSLIGLLEFEKAIQIFQNLINNNNNNNNSIINIKQTQQLINNLQINSLQVQGVYDFNNISFHPNYQNDIYDYLGPVEIKWCENNCSKGRGLFLTKDIQVGELLLAEKAFCFGRINVI